MQSLYPLGGGWTFKALPGLHMLIGIFVVCVDTTGIFIGPIKMKVAFGELNHLTEVHHRS